MGLLAYTKLLFAEPRLLLVAADGRDAAVEATHAGGVGVPAFSLTSKDVMAYESLDTKKVGDGHGACTETTMSTTAHEDNITCE